MAKKASQLDGKRVKFSSTYQPKNNGRKPNRYTKLIKEEKISSDDVSNMMSDILQMTEKELNDLINDEEKAYSLRVFAKTVKNGLIDGDLKNISVLLDRSVGKVTDKVEHSGSINLPQLVIEGFESESQDK